LHCPVTAVAGTRDPVVSSDQLRRWGEFTDGSFDVHQLPGGHFYWFDDVAPLCSILTRGLARVSSQAPTASARDGQVHQL
jgi:surfactin synthase thioesterase subunit